jgi:uncharacterized protein (DUF362 family)
MKRRDFLRKSSFAGAAAFTALSGIPKWMFSQQAADATNISIIEGTNFFKNTIEAVNNLGGIQRFVTRNDIVGLLINAGFETKGAYVNPDIPLAIIEECYNAGAKEIILLQTIPDNYWERTETGPSKSEYTQQLKVVHSNKVPAEYNEQDFTILKKVKGAEIIKDIEVIKAVLDCDVFINIPIAKHHATTFVTASLKNMMGIQTRASNVTFHLGSGERNNPEYLGQCIAELNLVRKPDLVVMDASEMIITNGPSGPGEMNRFDHVLAGTDPVAMDVLACEYVGYAPRDIVSIVKAHEIGVGSMDISKLAVEKVIGS